MEQTRTRRLSVTAKHLQGTDGLRVSIADAFDQVTRLYCTVDALPPACYSARCECSVRLAPAVQSPSTPWVPSLSRSISGGSRRACCEVWTLFGTAPTLCVALFALCHCCHRCLYPPNYPPCFEPATGAPCLPVSLLLCRRRTRQVLCYPDISTAKSCGARHYHSPVNRRLASPSPIAAYQTCAHPPPNTCNTELPRARTHASRPPQPRSTLKRIPPARAPNIPSPRAARPVQTGCVCERHPLPL